MTNKAVKETKQMVAMPGSLIALVSSGIARMGILICKLENAFLTMLAVILLGTLLMLQMEKFN